MWWRRRRDSNPRDGFPPTPLAGERLRPLGHISADGLQSYVRKEQERIVKIDIFSALNRILQMNCPTLHALIAETPVRCQHSILGHDLTLSCSSETFLFHIRSN